MIIETAHAGSNAGLVASAIALYAKEGNVIADVTYGRGAFWRDVDLSRFTFLPSDILPKPPAIMADFRRLPYRDASADIIVLDPPYIHNPGKHMTDARYENAATTKGLYHDDIIELYRLGMVEAARVMRSEGGQLWVKCKDQVESGVQRWSHIELFTIAQSLGMFARDLFVIVPSSRTSFGRWAKQVHARKTHSYLWIFEKPARSYMSALRRAGQIVDAA